MLANILKAKANNITENDEFFEDEIEHGELPPTAEVIRQILYDECSRDVDGATYGYSLGIICDYLGQPITSSGHGIYNVGDHPYEEKLSQSQLPVRIPKPGDFPEIGHLTAEQVQAEIEVAQKYIDSDDRPENKWSQMSDEELENEVMEYLEILSAVKEMSAGLVSFRH